jgi:alkanesulfonate monooxygenase SsuD/methylene tetrahydromethanopterin reductase-like flavin-dependent oxidoreductase (luciferase family)
MAVPDIGIFLPSMSPSASVPPGDVVAAGRHAEELGFESVWVVDQLVAGVGVPVLESGTVLAAVAGATTRLRLGFGVMIVPLRPVAWIAKQVASLQAVSGGRVLFGAGVGGDRHDLAWDAAGVPRRERGRRTDAALRALPGLLAGEAVRLPDVAGEPEVRLLPGVPVPPILVGGAPGPAGRRLLDVGGEAWMAPPLPPDVLADEVAKLAAAAEERGRPAPGVTAGVLTAMSGDPALPDADGLLHRLTDPNGQFGMPAEAVPQLLVQGSPAEVAERFAGYAEAGVDRIVVSLAGGDWHRQAELVAEAVGRLR